MREYKLVFKSQMAGKLAPQNLKLRLLADNPSLTLSAHVQEGYSTHFCQSVIHSTADLKDSSPSTFKSDIKLKYWII